MQALFVKYQEIDEVSLSRESVLVTHRTTWKVTTNTDPGQMWSSVRRSTN